MRVRLEVTQGPETGRIFDFDRADSFLVGRSPKAHLILDPTADRQVSRTHFVIDIRPPRCHISDLESTNGTRVNGAPIRRAELHHGDLIQIGKTTIRAQFADDAGPQDIRVQCAKCRQDVTHELPGRLAAELETMIYTCRSCREAEEAERAAATRRGPSQPAPPKTWCCDDCGRDLTRIADADGRAAEIADAHYLCPTCAVRHKDLGQTVVDMGPYRILSTLGQGGMGVVYKAVDRDTRRVCAIKQILPDAARDDHAMKLFDREVGVQSMVDHPNLVTVLGRGRHRDTCYFALEYLAGGDVEQLVTKKVKGPVAPGAATEIIRQILNGLEALHQKGFIHRDLKPANFLLSRPFGDPLSVAKITDYGLAKSFEEAGNSLFDFSQAGDACGSLFFMPPEQILDYRFIRPPADLYAVGVSLYYLLTAAYTVDFPSPLQLVADAARGVPPKNPLQMILEDPPIPVRSRNPSIPSSLAAVVDIAVRKEPTERFQTASNFRNELEAAIGKGAGHAV